MSAVDTATRVIEWAIIGEGLPPKGDVSATELLAHPPASLRLGLSRLTALTAAQLRYSSPPMRDDRPIGVGVLVIAAAIGCSSVPQLVGLLLRTVPKSSSAAELVARHGTIAPALKFLPPDLATV